MWSLTAHPPSTPWLMDSLGATESSGPASRRASSCSCCPSWQRYSARKAGGSGRPPSAISAASSSASVAPALRDSSGPRS